MAEMRFEWNEAKNRANLKKHGVSFEEAQTVFLDDHAIRFFDPDHSDDEDRFIMLGGASNCASSSSAIVTGNASRSFVLSRQERPLGRKPHTTGGER